MKQLFTSIVFFSATSFVGLAISSTWPQVNGLLVNSACDTQTTFRSLKPIPYCSDLRVVSRQACRMGGKLCHGEYFVEQTSCYQMSGRDIEVSREVTTPKYVKSTAPSEADGGQWLKYQTTTSLVGTEFKVAMWETGPQGPKNYLGELDFSVPACR